MYTVNHLSITTDQNRILVSDLSFTMNHGDKIAIIGEEGNGKSTLLKALSKQESLNLDHFQVSFQLVPDHPVIQYLPQFLEPKWADMSAHDFLVDAADSLFYDYDAQKERELVKQFSLLLSHLQLEDLDRPMASFSGGESIRLRILKMMLSKPDLYFLDEPTNDLDIETLLWLERWMHTVQQPILFVSHDTQLLRDLSTKVIHLEQRKHKQSAVSTFFNGSYGDYIQSRQLMIDKTNQMANKERQDYQDRLQRWQKLYQTVEYQQRNISRQNAHGGALLKKHMRHLQAQKRQLDSKELTATIEPEEAITLFFNVKEEERHGAIIQDECESLAVGDRVLSHDLNLSLEYGEKLSCIGANGVGKSTYMHYLYDKYTARGLKIAMMQQNYIDPGSLPLSAIDYLVPDRNKQAMTRAMTMLGNLNFMADEMTQPLQSLSMGQIAKVALLDLVMSDADLLFLDEPTRNLSPLSLDVVIRMFQAYPRTIFCISHDRFFIKAISDRILLMRTDGFSEVEAADL